MGLKINSTLLSEVSEIFLYSNNAKYFYKNLRDIEELRTIANESSSLELILLFFNSFTFVSKRYTDLIIIYIALIALTYKNHSEVSTFFEAAKKINVKWVAELVQLYLDQPNLVINNVSIKNRIINPPILSALSSDKIEKITLN